MSNYVFEQIQKAHRILLSTHRNCDGDGLGSQIALLHALRRIGKDASIINVDHPSPKYAFLNTSALVKSYDNEHPIGKADLALIFDTNDSRLLEPLYSQLVANCREVLFVDHHPILEHGPSPTKGSLVDTSAASTGEVVLQLIEELKIELDAPMARALYTSLVFDTQLFRYVKSDPRSHLMAAKLLAYEKNPEEVHRHLFATYTLEKIAFLARSLSRVEYLIDNHAAFVALDAVDFAGTGLHGDEATDVVDLVMNVSSVEVAALAREEAPAQWKVSFRAKGRVPVLETAESLGGGGHTFAAGARIAGERSAVREQIITVLTELTEKYLGMHPGAQS
jgi:phosphoesterase RecJ-like protein